jgi:hypothetical protein
MIAVKNNFLYSPGGENEGAAVPEENEKTNEPLPGKPEEETHHKPLGEKIKEALQDWSNKDKADQDFDDTRV